MTMTEAFRPPREDLVRAQPGGYEVVRIEGDGDSTPVMRGHFGVFDQWTEINSMFEGNFMESMAPGAFKKTMNENASNMRSLFNHGHDPTMGDQVLGRIAELREDDTGGYYEVELFRSVPPLIMEGLEAGQYGASFRFNVLRETRDENPGKSDHNPKGLPERVVKEANVREFGPVTFPAYAGASAGLRSMTDEYLVERMGLSMPTRDVPDAPSEGAGQEPPPPERRETVPDEPRKDSVMNTNLTLPELESRAVEIKDELALMDADLGTGIPDDTQKKRMDDLTKEFDEVVAQVAAKKERIALLERVGSKITEAPKDTATERGVTSFQTIRQPEDIWDLSTVRGAYDDPTYAKKQLTDRAHRAVDEIRLATIENVASHEDRTERAHDLISNHDSENGDVARRVLVAGHPDYEEAFWRTMMGRPLTSKQSWALDRAFELERALGQATAGYAVPIALDPTVSLTSNGVVNPMRAVARVVTVAGSTWKGVNSAGITASYDAEAAEVSDDTPTLTQPSTTVLTARAFVPFSIESEDWTDLRAELTREFQDAKDSLESNRFTLGTGSPQPQGFTVGATNLATTAGTAAMVLADLDTLTDCLPPRYQPGAVMMANRSVGSKIRQIARTTGVTSEWAPTGDGLPPQLLGYPYYENSAMVATPTTSAALTVAVGDFQKGFVIVDRIGMNVESIPHLFHTSSNLPSGQRGLFAFWRNTSVVRDINAIRILKVL